MRRSLRQMRNSDRFPQKKRNKTMQDKLWKIISFRVALLHVRLSHTRPLLIRFCNHMPYNVITRL